METGFPAIFTLQDSQCVLPLSIPMLAEKLVCCFVLSWRRSITASNLLILAVYFLCTSDSYIFLSCFILHLLRLSYIISHKLNHALPGSMYSFSRNIYVIYLSMVGWWRTYINVNYETIVILCNWVDGLNSAKKSQKIE